MNHGCDLVKLPGLPLKTYGACGQRCRSSFGLRISPRSAETHTANLMQKLGLHNTAEIVLYAVRKSLVS